MDPDPNPANILRTLFVAKSRSWGKEAFLCLKIRMCKIWEQKKRSFGQFLIYSRTESKIRIRIRIRIRIPKLTSGRIRIRYRIRNFCFGSPTLLKPSVPVLDTVVCRTEVGLLKAVDWRLGQTTAVVFLHFYTELLGRSSRTLARLARALLDLALTAVRLRWPTIMKKSVVALYRFILISCVHVSLAQGQNRKQRRILSVSELEFVPRDIVQET